MDKQINGLDLADYKDIEHEAMHQITASRKVLMISQTILDGARAAIKSLGGLTAIDELKQASAKEAEQRAKTK